jgi:hypothetical protein
MSGCKIKRNLVSSSETKANGDKNCSTEVSNKLAEMMAEREKQDKNIHTVMTEKEYEEKYGKQPIGDVKPK